MVRERHTNGGRLRRPPVVYRIAAARVKRRRVPLWMPDWLPRFPPGCIMMHRQQWFPVSWRPSMGGWSEG